MTIRIGLGLFTCALGALVACSSNSSTTASPAGAGGATAAASVASTTTASVAASTAGSGGAGAGGAGGGSCTAAMYSKYGAAAFTQVTDDLVTLAAADPQVGHYFSGLDTPAKVSAFEVSLDNFLVLVYGGPNNYTGPDMATAHAGLAISSDDYDYFVGLIVQVLMKDGVTTEDIGDCFAPPVVDPTFKASIVGK
jgi:hemoglobin